MGANIFSPSTLESVATDRLRQESSACADTTLPPLYYVNTKCVWTCVCASTHIGVHVQRNTVNRTPSPPPPSPPSFFLSLSLFLLHHSTPPEAKPAFLSVRLSLSPSLSNLFFFYSPPLFSPLLSLAFQPSFVVAERRGGREEGGGSPKHERRQNVNGGALCRGAHGRCRASLRHQSVVVLTLMFSCVDQKLLWSETSGGRGGASVACQKLKHLGEKKNRTPTPTINEQQSDTYFVQLRQVMVL